MIEPTIAAADLETWASFLLEHSLGGVGADDRVMVKGERIAWPLIAVLERRIAQAGAVPDVLLVPPNNERGRVWSATMARHASSAQLARVPDWHRLRYESMTKYVEVLGAEEPALYSGLDAAQVKELAVADRPFSMLRIAKPWVLTLYPTAAFAALEGMPLEEYTAFIVRASTTDPRPLRAAEEELAPLVREARRMRILTRHPQGGRELELRLELGSSLVLVSWGLRNFPDGEVFTSPDARSAEGELYLDLPVHYGGTDIGGIYLRLHAGEIVEYRAELGHEQLRAIVETDAGSHRLGEVAFGMNPGLVRALKHPLFVEKVGGTLHVAIGASFDDCFVEDSASEQGRRRIQELEAQGIINRSAQHVDLVADFRPGGCGRRVFLDEREIVVRDGLWRAL
jgi:aminopeptidase